MCLDSLSEFIQAAFYPGTIYLLSRLVVCDSNFNSIIDFLQAGTLKRLVFVTNMYNLPSTKTYQCSWQELALRSCILYGGFIVSNAFGSVRFEI